ncbi:MAG: DoxX family protein [Acidobacteria bacterium]|nr:MAG: DoxX family protein [Acidobacteriota bacterium]REK02671.1 MAG: DoxX family protein [Acidobacteriota bacterium]REK13524.1 MAG: DoxX family protein [Acidobacteriota bacterium]REK41518.1 MAG: DoxX family protein [Acidobacteriota bacterium]
MSTGLKVVSWICRIVVALIFIQTLFFKFTGAEESKFIFSELMGADLEAVGRIGSGFVELVAAVLLLVPRTVVYGALLALATISGAIFIHLTVLGIVVADDGGTLFILAIVVFLLSAVLLFIHRQQLPLTSRVSQV